MSNKAQTTKVVAQVEPDFNLVNNFSFYLLMPRTETAKEWIDANVQLESYQSKKAIYVETRYVYDIVQGIKNAGLTIN